MDLRNKKCVPCSKGAPRLKGEELQKYLGQIDGNWELVGKMRIEKVFSFGGFREAMNFVNEVAQVVQSENHHPNIYLHDFNKVKLELWTHKIGGLHENDFILASKIDRLRQ